MRGIKQVKYQYSSHNLVALDFLTGKFNHLITFIPQLFLKYQPFTSFFHQNTPKIKNKQIKPPSNNQPDLYTPIKHTLHSPIRHSSNKSYYPNITHLTYIKQEYFLSSIDDKIIRQFLLPRRS